MSQTPLQRAPVVEFREGGWLYRHRGLEAAVHFVRHARARRYWLRLRADGALRVTIPVGGSRQEAIAFLCQQWRWVERRLRLWRENASRPDPWHVGGTIFYRGEPHEIRVEPTAAGGRQLRVGDLTVRTPDADADPRPLLEAAFRREAERRLPPRAVELARVHGFRLDHVSIRNQRTRWGSCNARRRSLSLNWRLILMPPEVADYVVLHELAHLRVPNHSAAFWRLVGELCPRFREAEAWIRQHAPLLR
ncbi:MAG: M48 family peptidase [Verrucomicrobia bacterium]|nr:MAG: M48 family peptidase [Verrucomicrobiota bacterium]